MPLQEFLHEWDWINFNELLTIHMNTEAQRHGGAD